LSKPAEIPLRAFAASRKSSTSPSATLRMTAAGAVETRLENDFTVFLSPFCKTLQKRLQTAALCRLLYRTKADAHILSPKTR